MIRLNTARGENSIGGYTRNDASRCERRSTRTHRSCNADHESEYYITRQEQRRNMNVRERATAVRVSGYEVEKTWAAAVVRMTVTSSDPLPYPSNHRNQVASCQPCRPVKTRSFRIVIVALPFMVPQLPPTATNCGYYSLP